MRRIFNNLAWKEVQWSRPLSLEVVHDILTNLATTTPRSPIIWEVRGSLGKIRYLIGAENNYILKVLAVFRAHGDVRFVSVVNNIVTRQPMVIAKRLQISRPMLSIRTDLSQSVIRAGLAAITSANNKHENVMQVILGPTYAPKSTANNIPDPHKSWLTTILYGTTPASTETRSIIRDKAACFGFEAVLRLGSTGDATQLSGLFSALKILETVGVHISASPENAEHINNSYVPWHFHLRLSVKELSSLLLPPVGVEQLPGLSPLHPKNLLPPSWYRNPNPVHDRTFAVASDASGKIRLSISPQDSLEHGIIMGPTGSGKSTVLLRLISADINAGRSVLVIDPKADLVNDILARIPATRMNDVVVIDPTDTQPVGINPFSLTKENPTLIADAVLTVLKNVFADNWGILSDEMLSAALLTLARAEGASLLWLPTLFTNERFRSKIIAGLHDEIGLKPFWVNYENMKESERRQEIAPALRKIRQYLFRPNLRNVLGQSHPKFSLDELFCKRRIVLVPLNKGVIGPECAKLLGSLIIGLVWILALSRTKLPPERRHIVNVFVDELQDYIALPTDLADALAQARGLGVSLTMAHQYRNQLPTSIRSAIDANARNKIVFGLNIWDAKDMAAMASELEAQDFTALPRYHVYTNLSNPKIVLSYCYNADCRT